MEESVSCVCVCVCVCARARARTHLLVNQRARGASLTTVQGRVHPLYRSSRLSLAELCCNLR